jgi:cyclohexadienyl dehydratase
MPSDPRRSGLPTATTSIPTATTGIQPRRLLLVLLTWVCPLSASAAPDLSTLIDARLELMDEVAAYKWRHDLPIEDPERETVVLDSAVADALRYGFTPASSRHLFAAQIEAAKAIQRHWFGEWQGGQEPARVPDLNAQVRPELLRLGTEILAAAAADGGRESAEQFRTAVQVTGLDATRRDALLAAVQGLQRYPDRLTQILDTGVLRIGTTGDYAPFSHRADGDAAYRGIDIDLGQRLAEALGVEAVFVATSWPTLMDDLQAGLFDVGMSGISRTVERARNAFLSRAYYVGGKAPIARCDQVDRFARLSDIDRPGVRVVVNPGGTNERFVDARLHHATKILHPDNRTIFDVIEAGDADVMITDRVEVELQSSRREALCPAMTGTLSYQEKGYLLPRDTDLAAFVGVWLDLALAEGVVAEVFRAHGVEHRPGDGGH